MGLEIEPKLTNNLGPRFKANDSQASKQASGRIDFFKSN